MNSSLSQELEQRLAALPDLEEKIDGIRIFKKEKVGPLEEGFLNGELKLESLLNGLSSIADSILIGAHQLARENLRSQWGVPRIKDNDGNFLPGEVAIIAMGKLGGKEIHFGSDLDIISVFNKNGNTHGGKVLTNQEYFSRLLQRIISYLTLHTRRGYAYKVDTELRPSGNAGALITPLDAWVTYYHERAQIWEKQALLKARLIMTTGNFAEEFKGLFRRLIFLVPFPEHFEKEIHHLRTRIELELAKEDETRWHFKKGLGGVIDIEFIVQFLQLRFGKLFEDILKPNTLDALEALKKHQFLSPEQLSLLENAYRFYRNLEIYLELAFQVKDGFVDPTDPLMDDLAHKMSIGTGKELVERFSHYREKTREIYQKTFKIGND